MRTVTLEEHKTLDRLYHNVKFPLTICHSTEEFNEVTKGTNPIIISTMDELVKFTAGYERDVPNYIQDKNVWIATGEIYRPDTWINGVIFYQVNEKGNPIPTDNCYVQLVSFWIAVNRIIVATSSGVYMIGMFGKWVTAAKKSNFSVIAEHPENNSMERRKKNFEKLLKRKRLSASDVRFIYYLMLPNMPFKTPYQAALKAYGAWITVAIAEKLLETERIKEGIIKEIRKMIPNFDEILMKVYPLEELAGDMKKMVQKTLEVDATKYNVDATRKALKTVMEAIDNKAVLSPFQPTPLIPGTTPQMISSEERQKTFATEQSAFLNEETIAEFEKSTGTPLSGGFKSFIDFKE